MTTPQHRRWDAPTTHRPPQAMLFDSFLPELTPCREDWAPQARRQHPVPPPAPRRQGGAGGSPFSTQKFQTSRGSDPSVTLGTLYAVPYIAVSVPSCRTGALFAKLYKHPGPANSPLPVSAPSLLLSLPTQSLCRS